MIHPLVIRPEIITLGLKPMMQEPLFQLVRFDLFLETISAIIALLISHRANLAFRLTRQKRLSDLSTGFLVLSAGMFGRVIGTIYFFVIEGGGLGEEAEILQAVVTIAYGAMRIMAYILFSVSTRRGGKNAIPAEIPMLALFFLIDPNLELIAIIVLLIVVLQGAMNYAAVRSRFALYVLIGFLFLLLSHIFGIVSLVDFRAYGVSQVLQFLGLISLLVMLIKAGREP